MSCAVVTLRKIEADERRPSVQLAERLAEVFSIPARDLKAFVRFARGEWGAAPAEPEQETPWRASHQDASSRLPARITSLVGRQKEIAQVLKYLQSADTRLITLIGPPGIGKTRLGLETLRRPLPAFPDGVFFIALAALDDPRLIAPTIIQALGYVHARNVPDDRHLVESIGARHMLLMLDNCEHLVEAVASLASELLSGCTHLKILCTSREALRVQGEWIYRVPALDAPGEGTLMDAQDVSSFPALALFEERARAIRSDFSLDAGNIPAVASICARLDGLPLAIELVAARVRWMAPQALLANLREQLALEGDGMRALPRRQQTLNGAIDWSFRLLSDEERELFTDLAVFAGGFTPEAAGSVCSGTVASERVGLLTASLADKSLLQPGWDDGETRFSMLTTVRQFALDRLRASDRETQIRNRHLAHFLYLAERADSHIHGPDQIQWMDRMEAEHDNFRAALDWSLSSGQTELGLRLFGALSWFRRLRGYLDEARAGFERLRSQPDLAAYPAAYAKVLNAMGRVTWLQGDYQQAQRLLDESRGIWQKLGPDGARGLAEALDFLGLVARSGERDGKLAQALFRESVELYRRCADQWGFAEGLFHLGISALARHETAVAVSMFEQSLALFRQLGDLWAIGRVSSQLGGLHVMLGDLEQAQLILQQGLEHDRRLGFKQGIINDLLMLADLNWHRGNYEEAARFSEQGLSLSREYGLKPDRCDALYLLGLLALHRADYSAAGHHFAEVLTSTMASRDGANTCRAMIGLAAAAGGRGQYERAAKLAGAAQALYQAADFRPPPLDQAEFDRHIGAARERLGNVPFEALSAEGGSMPLETAVEYALASLAGA